MVKATLAVSAASLLAACSTAAIAPQTGPEPMHAEPNAPAAISLAEILGQWDVVSFEGYEPPTRSATRTAIADFFEWGVQLRVECNISRRGGVVRDGQFVGQGMRTETEMGCGEEREERDRRYFSFFDRSPAIEPLPDRRLRLTAGDSVLILERREQRRLAFVPDRSELEGHWRMKDLTRYGREGGSSGIGLSDVPGRIVIQGNRLSYDRCPRYDLTISYSADGRLVKTGGSPLPEKPDCPALNYPDYEAPALPSAMEILPLLHSNPWVENVGNGQLLVANERYGLLLARSSESR